MTFKRYAYTYVTIFSLLLQSWDTHFATPSAPPFHRPSIDTMDSPSFSPPPKQQRLVSPSSLEGSPFKIRSPLSSSPHCTPASRSFGQDTPPRGGASGDDTMHHSPPHIEQLRLFDTPHTPKSIIRRSTMARLPRDSVLQRFVCGTYGAHEMQAGREWNGSSVVLFVLCMGIHFLDTT